MTELQEMVQYAGLLFVLFGLGFSILIMGITLASFFAGKR